MDSTDFSNSTFGKLDDSSTEINEFNHTNEFISTNKTLVEDEDVSRYYTNLKPSKNYFSN